MKIIVLTVLLAAVGGSAAFAADARSGQASYDKSCKGCHGAAGAPSAGMAKMFPAMPDLSASTVQGESDAELAGVITDGKGKMKPVKLTSGSASDVVAYVRTMKK